MVLPDSGGRRLQPPAPLTRTPMDDDDDDEGHVHVLCVLSDQQLSDCFLVHFTPTQTCTEAFDKFFRSFVSDKQYSNACR